MADFEQVAQNASHRLQAVRWDGSRYVRELVIPASSSGFNPTVGLLSERSNFDNEAEGFAFIASDTSQLFFRVGDPGNWSDPIPFGEGTNLSYDAATRTLSSNTGTDVVLPLATQTEAGLLSADDKKHAIDGVLKALPVDADLDAIVEYGRYERNAASGTVLNAPSTDFGILEVEVRGTRIWQTYKTLGAGSGGETFVRIFNDSGWSSWAEIGAGGSGSTNLSYDAASRTVVSSSGTDATLTLADATNPGLMSVADKGKLDTLSGDKANAIFGLTWVADRLVYFTGATTAALATFTAYARTLLAAADDAAARVTLGLGNVDNTADIDKPISNATDAALKARLIPAGTTGQLAVFADPVDDQEQLTGADVASGVASDEQIIDGLAFHFDAEDDARVHSFAAVTVSAGEIASLPDRFALWCDLTAATTIKGTVWDDIHEHAPRRIAFQQDATGRALIFENPASGPAVNVVLGGAEAADYEVADAFFVFRLQTVRDGSTIKRRIATLLELVTP